MAWRSYIRKLEYNQKYNPNVLIAVDDNTKRKSYIKQFIKKIVKIFLKKSYLAKSSKLKLSKKTA